MSSKANSTIATMGIDIGKNSFHVVGLDERGAIVVRQGGRDRSAAARPSAAAHQAATRDVRPPKTAGDPARTTTAWCHVAVNFPNYHSKSISSRFKVLNFSLTEAGSRSSAPPRSAMKPWDSTPAPWSPGLGRYYFGL